MTSFFGHNVFTYDARFIAHVEQLQPAALLFLDNDGGAADAARRLPGCRVIARAVNDGYEKHLHETPGETLRYVQRRAKAVARSCYINLGCEPPNQGSAGLQLLVREYSLALDWAIATGVKVAAPHLAHYWMGREQWPILAPLAAKIAEHPDLLLWTVDEYFAGHAFSGVADPTLAGGSEAGHIQPETWRKSPVSLYYHVGRIGGLFAYLRARGLPLPLTVIAEGGPDALGDVEAWRESLTHTPGYPKINGWKSLQRQWDAWYGARGWTAARAFREMLQAMRREIYAEWPNVMGYCLFVYGTNGDPTWLPYNTADDALLEELEMTNADLPAPAPPPPMEAEPKPREAGSGRAAVLQTRSVVRIRSAPTTAAPIAASAPAGVAVTWYPATERDSTGSVRDGLRWVWVEARLSPQVVVTGWMARVWPTWEDQFSPPVPDAPPFVLANPLGVPWVYSSRFDDPRDYSKIAPNALQKHEGVDIVPKAGEAPPFHVLAAQTGVVEAVGYDADGYGHYVKLRHDWHGQVWRTYYGHLASVADGVKQGATVTVGTELGLMGASGNASGPHLHLTLQHVGHGKAGYVVADVVDPAPYLAAVAAPIEEPPTEVPETPVPPIVVPEEPETPPVPPVIIQIPDDLKAAYREMKDRLLLRDAAIADYDRAKQAYEQLMAQYVEANAA